MGTMNAWVVTVSDRVSAGTAEDRSGPAAQAALSRLGFEVERRLVPDGLELVATILREAVIQDLALVVTTGGTGFSPRDVTPEATLDVVERLAPGLVEAMRAATLGVNPHGMLSRSVAGIAARTLIVNLPGSVAGVEESIQVIGPALGHAVELVRSVPTEHKLG